MIIIKEPDIRDPLIDSIFAYIEAEAAKETPRGYVGASSIGDDCELKLWLKRNHPTKAAPRRAKLILAANDGHRGEDLAATYLRQIPGIELWTHDAMGNQYGFSELEGQFRGHADGFISGIPLAPKTVHVWENKVCNQKKFDELQKITKDVGMKAALEKWNYQYYCQAVMLMEAFELTRHYTTVWLSGNRDLQTIRTDANPELAAQLRMKAARIVMAKYPPLGISTNPSWFKCKKDFCEFSDNCPSIHPELKELYAPADSPVL